MSSSPLTGGIPAFAGLAEPGERSPRDAFVVRAVILFHGLKVAPKV